jgi:hypothetical protein
MIGICHCSNRCCTNFGHAYNSDAGVSGEVVFTGGRHFGVREIEAFEMTLDLEEDSRALNGERMKIR